MVVGSFCRLKKVENEREILKIMRKNSDINSFYYFNEMLYFN